MFQLSNQYCKHLIKNATVKFGMQVSGQVWRVKIL